MSDLLNQASLVYIPSGYKEDTAYSVIPTDGSGDLTFTRASDGTRVNSQGLVERVPWNLAQYSEDQTQWTSQNQTTVTANSTTAPNGTITADTVTPSTANDDHYRGIILSQQIGVLTAFIYVKPNGYNFFDWGIYNGSQYIVRATFDLVNLTYTFTNAGTATIESVGNGWLKCGISGTNASLTTVSLYYRSRPTGGSGNYAGDGTSGAFVWGAQLNEGSTAKPYFPTTDRQNVPRLDYSNGCPSLLLEPQRTNLITYSEQFDNAAWNKQQITLSANATTSPDGTQNADSIIPTTTNSSLHRVYENSSNSLATASYSIFVKPNGYYRVALRESASTGAAIGFNLLNETIITTYSTGGCTASGGKIENMGNGWYRISGVFSFASATSQSLGLYVVSSSWTSGDPESVAWSGNGTSGIYIYGAQLEAGSYPTSYIPTTSASVTRVADEASKTGISSLIGQTEGVVFWETEFTTMAATGHEGLLNIDDGAFGNTIYLFKSSTGYFVAEMYITGVQQASFSTSAQPIGTYKIALAYANNNTAFFINGAQVGTTDTSCGVPATSRIQLGNGALGPSTDSTKQLVLFKTRLTDAECIALTS